MAAAAGSGPANIAAGAAGLGPATVTAGRYKHPYLCAADFRGVCPSLTIGYWCRRTEKYKTILPEYTVERIETEILDSFHQQDRFVEGVDKFHVVTPRGEPPAISEQKYEIRVEVAEIIVERTLNARHYGDPDRYPTTDDDSQEYDPREPSQEEGSEDIATDEGNSQQETAPQEQEPQEPALLAAQLAAATPEPQGSGLIPNVATPTMQTEGIGGNKAPRKVKETAKRALSGLTGNGPDSDEEVDDSVEAQEQKDSPTTPTPLFGPIHLGSADHPIPVPVNTPPKLVFSNSTASKDNPRPTSKETKGAAHPAARLWGRFDAATSSNPPVGLVAGKRASFEASLGGSLEAPKAIKVPKGPSSQEREQLGYKGDASMEDKSSIDHPAKAPIQAQANPNRRLDPAHLLASRIRDMRELLRNKPMLCAHCENAGPEHWLTAQPGVYYVDDNGRVLCSNLVPATDSVPEQGCTLFRPSLENLRSLWINENGPPNPSPF